jgi:hypothetical protein
MSEPVVAALQSARTIAASGSWNAGEVTLSSRSELDGGDESGIEIMKPLF